MSTKKTIPILPSRVTVEGLDRAPHRAFLHGLGLSDADIARPFVGLLPNAELELMSGVGHAPWMDDPDGCASMTSSFLNR